MHGSKYSGFNSFDKLFGSPHVVPTHPSVYGEHSYIHQWGGLKDGFQFGQKVTLGFADFFGCGFFIPMPVVEVAGMEQWANSG